MAPGLKSVFRAGFGPGYCTETVEPVSANKLLWSLDMAREVLEAPGLYELSSTLCTKAPITHDDETRR